MKQSKMPYVDAQVMHQQYPETFYAPSPDELDTIKVGTNVKVCTGDERFWVEVTAVTESGIEGTVNNDLVFTDEHGLSLGDKIQVERRHIYNILR